MQGCILGLFAETYIHVGAGQSEQAIDLPVARERTTGYPFIPASGVKGALRDLAERHFGNRDGEELKVIYGTAEQAGDLLLSDARLLLLPVRCLTRAYLWLTCPYLVERLCRDLERAFGSKPNIEAMPEFAAKNAQPVVYCRGSQGEKLFLEERLFVCTGSLPEGLVDLVSSLVAVEPARQRLADQMAIISNDDFSWFARFALPVQAHNVLNDNKTSINLWYEESLAPDTLLYVVVLYRREATAAHLFQLFHERPYLQLGGNETTGQGWFRVARLSAHPPGAQS